MSKDAERLLQHLYKNTWVSVDHARDMGYANAIKEVTINGLATEQMIAGTPVVVISTRTQHLLDIASRR